MNGNSSTGAGANIPEVIEPELVTEHRIKTEPRSDDWLCAWCLQRVAHEQDRFSFEGKDVFSFSNPAGIRFEIITFSQTSGCRETGVPTLEATWFAGHAWSYCQCGQCGTHLGWYWTGPASFAGLITERLVRGAAIRN